MSSAPSIWYFLAVAVIVIVFFRWAAGRSTRKLSMPAETPVKVWRGGLKTRTISVTGRSAYLELFEWGLRISGREAWGVMPTWEVRYRELASAQMVKWPVANLGVLMRTDGSAVPTVFATPRGHEVLTALEARGVPVDWSVSRLRPIDLE